MAAEPFAVAEEIIRASGLKRRITGELRTNGCGVAEEIIRASGLKRGVAVSSDANARVAEEIIRASGLKRFNPSQRRIFYLRCRGNNSRKRFETSWGNQSHELSCELQRK